MILKVFDVAAGSCNFIQTSTGKTELVDFGANFDWSPVDHIYLNYIDTNGQLDRLVLTHHHGDHLKDWDNFGNRRPSMVVQRELTGTYLTACRSSNSDSSQRLAERVASELSSWTYPVADSLLNETAWGVRIRVAFLTVAQADHATSTYNAMANCCSVVRLYDHKGTKFLLAGDMEKEGMEVLLRNNASFRQELSGVDVLVAPHHGHSSGFSTELFDAMGRPAIVIASMMSGDDNVAPRYSDQQYVRGVRFEDGQVHRLLTTRSHGAITVESHTGGGFYITCDQR